MLAREVSSFAFGTRDDAPPAPDAPPLDAPAVPPPVLVAVGKAARNGTLVAPDGLPPVGTFADASPSLDPALGEAPGGCSAVAGGGAWFSLLLFPPVVGGTAGPAPTEAAAVAVPVDAVPAFGFRLG